MSNKTLVEWAGGSRVTLAIVFTDIVGSTALGVELADERMNEVRLVHFAHSRTLIAQHAGHEIKTIGDSVMAVFRSVGAALDYAQALHLDPGHVELWPRGVRAGIHIGSIDVIGNDVFGTEVAVAARVAHAIAGAEIWLSDQAKQDIGRAGLGRHRDLQWQPHDDIELKGLGKATLWSLGPSTARPDPNSWQVEAGEPRGSSRLPSTAPAEPAAWQVEPAEQMASSRLPSTPPAEPNSWQVEAAEKMASSPPDGSDDRTVILRGPVRSTLNVGKTLINGTYVIEAFLASGGMGEVYRARHIDHGTQHAIKVILPELANSERAVGLFIKESRNLERINSDAIVRYQGFLRDENGARYLVMEFVEGESLAAILQRRRFEPPEVFALLERIGQGLAAAHELGIVHRDISPDNIIIPGGQIGSAKLIDFGIVKSPEPNDLTLIGNDFAGKLSFVSPEQVGLFGDRDPRTIDLRSDIYSLGLVLATAALGSSKTLDMGGSLANVLQARQRVPDLSALPPSLRPIIGHMLQPRPRDRPESLQAVLEEAKWNSPTPPPAPQRHPKRLRRLGVWLVGALCVVDAAAVAIFFGAQLTTPSIDQVRIALAGAANVYRCADLSYSISLDRAVVMSGYVGSDQDLAHLHDALTGLRGVAKLDFDVRRRSWPFCEALSVLKPLLARGNHGASISLALSGNQTYVGSPLKLDIQAPNFDAYIYVDYFKPSGEVVHLFPNDRDKFEFRPARNTFMLGQMPMGNCWRLSGAPGQQMVALVASRKPLFDAALHPVDDAREYLPRLLQALAKAPSGQQAAATLFFELSPRNSAMSADAPCAPG